MLTHTGHYAFAFWEGSSVKAIQSYVAEYERRIW